MFVVMYAVLLSLQYYGTVYLCCQRNSLFIFANFIFRKHKVESFNTVVHIQGKDISVYKGKVRINLEFTGLIVIVFLVLPISPGNID